MRVLICGAGKVTRHLLKRLGERWQVTLIDKAEEKVNKLISESERIQRVIAGDASSPVILDEAGVGGFDYVLALTDSDKVNLAICKHALGQGVDHILARVNDQENHTSFQEVGVRTVMGSLLVAKSIHHYLQDPRINVTPLGLGRMEIMEIDVADHFQVERKRVAALSSNEWRLVAILRQDELLFPDPDTSIDAGDHLLILGRPDIFKEVCTFLECGQPRFPLAYGQSLLLGLAPGRKIRGIIDECMHLAQNIRIRNITVLTAEEESDLEGRLETWSQAIDIQVEKFAGDLGGRIQQISAEQNYGVVAIHPFDVSFLRSLTKPVLISLAHSLPCPLLISRHTHPYERILVPFNAKPMAELALEVAIDLARQLKAEVAVAVVEEPGFIRGEEEEGWVNSVFKRSREIAHIHKFQLKEIARKGNPVKEIVKLAEEFNLMVVGSTTREKGLFSPHVGELLAQEASCSVLIVAR